MPRVLSQITPNRIPCESEGYDDICNDPATSVIFGGIRAIQNFNAAPTVQPLLDYFDRLIPLSSEEKDFIHSKFRPHLFIKKQFALQHGQVCEYFDFVVRGCLRLYFIDKDGVYHILQFATENYWILDLTSFHKKTPAKLNIDALEDTMVLRINYVDLIDLYLKAPKFDRIFRELLENHFMLQQQ